uniref:Uncharacterized protein n=1 Tax=Haptolina brevifila TaxID=156173 RepID=A0A7S2IGY0_9EUKA|mmetsp:Transcript_65817/g.130455  ORF Transcript_65817/g.130455 Transcript_65817/m.130455 type:complete len:296 (+) Transcript_65817:58-945(+)
MADEQADAAPVVFKKPSRPRGNVRKREHSGDDDDAAVADADGTTSHSLEMMRELQRQRQRAKGVTLEAKGVGEAVDEALAIGGAANETPDAHGLESTFTSQTDSGEVDPSMLKYIEEQMQGGGGAGADSGAAPRGALDPEEAELYTTPAHLIGVLPESSIQPEEESASRWLAGIMEVPLGTEDKMAAIEETERAKRQMMARMAGKQQVKQVDKGREHQLAIPTNFNSNFHQHKRESVLLRKSGAGGTAGQGGFGHARGVGRDLSEGGPGGGGRSTMSSDGASFGRFKAQVRQQRR